MVVVVVTEGKGEENYVSQVELTNMNLIQCSKIGCVIYERRACVRALLPASVCVRGLRVRVRACLLRLRVRAGSWFVKGYF